MQIKWYGQSCFQITASQGKNKGVRLVIDPFDKTTGLRPPVLKEDILLLTQSNLSNGKLKTGKNNPFVIEGPGEYEIKNVFIQGIPVTVQITSYTITAENMRLCHLGGLAQKELTEEQLEETGPVDILMIPVGGVSTIDGRTAQKITAQIEPKIVIPMHYKIAKLKLKLESVDNFLKAIGQKTIKPEEKLVIKKKELPEEETKVVLLKP